MDARVYSGEWFFTGEGDIEYDYYLCSNTMQHICRTINVINSFSLGPASLWFNITSVDHTN